MGERLAKTTRRTGPGRRPVIGTTVQHNGSLGYIRRGPFRGNAQRRAARASLLHVLPYALGVLAIVLVLWGVGSLVQGGFNPFAGSAASGDASRLGTLSHAFVDGFATPPAQAKLQADSPGAVVLTPGRVTDSGTGRVTFSAVGDNIANENLLELADAAAGETSDDQYDFNAFYDGIRDAVQSYDISFINQETTLGGPDRYGYNGYPSYNTPDSLADAVVAAGWDVVSLDSNHTYDTGVEAIQHSLEVWGGKADDVLTLGSFASEEDRSRMRMVECNGCASRFSRTATVRMATTSPSCPTTTMPCRTPPRACRPMWRAPARWPTLWWSTCTGAPKYTHDPDETQLTRAQELADAGVDLVIGSHAHVIQPMAWVNGANGGKTLVVYGLGDVWRL